MTTFFVVLLGLLVWVVLGVFVAFCVRAGNGDVSDVALLPNDERRRRNGY